MTLSELLVKFGLSPDEASFTKAQLMVEGIKLGLGAIVGAANAAARGMVHAFHGVVETADKVDELAQGAGVTTDALQQLTYAASFTGMGLDDVGRSLGILTRNMGAARDGSEDVATAFSRIGVRITDGSGQLRNADAVMMDLAERFQAMPDGANKTALAMKIFGKSGAGMIPFLNAGREGIQKFREEADRLGITMDEATIKQGAAADDALNKLSKSWQGLLNQAIAPLIPVVTELINDFTAWIATNKDLIRQVMGVFAKGLKILVRTLGFVAKTLAFVIRNWKIFAMVITSVVMVALLPLMAELGLLISVLAAAPMFFLKAGAAALWAGIKAAAGWALAALPVIAIVAAFLLLLLLLEDVYEWITGGNSALKELWNEWKKFLDSWLYNTEGDGWLLKTLKAIVGTIREMPAVWDEFLEYIGVTPNGKRARKPPKGVSEDDPAFTAELVKDAEFLQDFGAYGARISSPKDRAERQTYDLMGSLWRKDTPTQYGPGATPPSVSVTINAPSGDAKGIAGEVRKVVEEFHEKTMRETEAAVK